MDSDCSARNSSPHSIAASNEESRCCGMVGTETYNILCSLARDLKRLLLGVIGAGVTGAVVKLSSSSSLLATRIRDCIGGLDR